MFTNTVVAAALLAFAPSVFAAVGNTIIENNCGFPVYLWSVANIAGPEVVVPAGKNYTEAFYTNPNGGGISVKMAANAAAASVTQFEYTLDGASLWYDVSNINGYPFESWGLTLVPSDPTCASVTCDAGVAQCKDVYNQSNDDAATHECESSANMVMVLCSGNTAAASSIMSSAVVAATSNVVKQAPAPTPVTSTSTVAPSTTLITSTKNAVVSSTKTSTTSIPTSTKTSSSSVKAVETSAAPIVTVAAAPAPTTTAATASSAVDVVLTTTYTTVYVTEGGVTKTSSSAVIVSTTAAASTSEAPAPTSTIEASSTSTTSSSTTDRVFHGHTFNWPAYTGFPGAKVRRGHQHFHAHAHGAHHA